MPSILDIYTDKSLKGLVSIVRNKPSYYDRIKTAEVAYDKKAKLPESAYAWPEKRAYPINGKEAALVSALYRTQFPPELAKEAMEVPAHVDDNLEKAAYLYGFEIPAKVTKKQQVKVASIQSDDYLIPNKKWFPVRNKNEAKLAEKVIIKNAHVMGYDHLTEASHRLVEKMASYKAGTEELNPIIFKYAGMTLSNPEFLDASISRRLDFTKGDMANSYKKLLKISEEMDYNRGNLVKVAATLEELDKQAKVRHLYDKYIPNPIESVFNTLKVRSVTKTAGHGMFTPDMADMVTSEQVKTILGDDILEETMVDKAMDKDRLVEVINSLPQDMITDFIERTQ